MISAILSSAVSAAGAVLDLVLKNGVEALPDKSFPRDVPGTRGKVQLRKLHNPGFPMGTLAGRPEIVRGLPLAVVSVLTGRFLLLAGEPGKLPEKLGLAAVIGGGLSNLFDRFFRGFVVDYIHVKAGPLDQIIFNLGDAMIASGGALMAGTGFLRMAAGASRGKNPAGAETGEETGGNIG